MLLIAALLYAQAHKLRNSHAQEDCDLEKVRLSSGHR